MSNVAKFEKRQPPKQVWYMRVDGGLPTESGLYWILPRKPPSAFHCWMMRFCFGWRVTNKIENERQASQGEKPT